MRYAVTTPADNKVYSCDTYSGSDWAAFKAAYETDHSGYVLVELPAGSQFPFGQGWQETQAGLYEPTDGQPRTHMQLKAGIAKMIASKTYELQFNTPALFSFGGLQFTRSENARHWLLGMLANRNNTTYPCYFPASAPFGQQLEINDADEMSDFIQPLYDESLTLQEAGNAQMAALAALSTIEAVVTYVDPR